MLRQVFRIFFEPDGKTGGDPPGSAPAAEGDSKETTEFRMPKFGSQLSPELREKYKKELHEYADKSLNDVWTDLVDSQTKLSRALIIPDKDGDPERFKADTKAFMAKMGIPETPDGYELKYDKKILADEAFIKSYRENALKRGLTKTQAQAGLADLEALAKQGLEAIKRSRDDAEKGLVPNLRKALVVNGDEKKAEKDADAVMNLAKKNLVRFGARSGDTLQKLADSGLMFDHNFIMELAEHERAMADAKFIDGNKPDDKSAVSNGGGIYVKNYSKKFTEQYGCKL